MVSSIFSEQSVPDDDELPSEKELDERAIVGILPVVLENSGTGGRVRRCCEFKFGFKLWADAVRKRC